MTSSLEKRVGDSVYIADSVGPREFRLVVQIEEKNWETLSPAAKQMIVVAGSSNPVLRVFKATAVSGPTHIKGQKEVLIHKDGAMFSYDKDQPAFNVETVN